jgi:UDP-N-acetylmuramoylalanine--D-glutamate ligase
MSAALFARLAEIPVIGVTGTRGKTTVTCMISEILTRAGYPVILGGNIRGVSTLAQLPHVTKESVAVLELDSWQLQGFREEALSPSIAVFTTFFSDHMNYYGGSMEKYLADKAEIFLHQKPSDTCVAGSQAYPYIREAYAGRIPSHVVVADAHTVPDEWTLRIPGEHNRFNAGCALAAARAFGIPDDQARSALEAFEGVQGRLEFVKEVHGVRIYNDNNSTTPEATIVGLRALAADTRTIVLIMGGDDKGLDMSGLISEIPRTCKSVVLFKERGTDRIRDAVFALQSQGVRVFEEQGLEACVVRAREEAAPGDSILFSPAFSSFGAHFKNEYDRNDQFMALVAKIA